MSSSSWQAFNECCAGDVKVEDGENQMSEDQTSSERLASVDPLLLPVLDPFVAVSQTF